MSANVKSILPNFMINDLNLKERSVITIKGIIQVHNSLRKGLNLKSFDPYAVFLLPCK